MGGAAAAVTAGGPEPPGSRWRVRAAAEQDLADLNGVIEAAVLGWPLAERVKRLSLPLLRYDAMDLRDYTMLLVTEDEAILGVAAWCQQRDQDSGLGDHLLLHGLYVLPSAQGLGIGSLLIDTVLETACADDLRGVLVKAERVSASYFEGAGFVRLAAGDARGADYPYRFWISTAP